MPIDEYTIVNGAYPRVWLALLKLSNKLYTFEYRPAPPRIETRYGYLSLTHTRLENKSADNASLGFNSWSHYPLVNYRTHLWKIKILVDKPTVNGNFQYPCEITRGYWLLIHNSQLVSQVQRGTPKLVSFGDPYLDPPFVARKVGTKMVKVPFNCGLNDQFSSV